MGINRTRGWSLPKCTAVVALVVLAGCAQSAPEALQPPQATLQPPQTPQPQSTFRQAAETAPADLQLVCAGEAARQFEVASDRVLPVASSLQGETFTVVLNAGGTEATCIIDNDGNVLSLVRT